MTGNIFISYRRDDEPGYVHAIYAHLEKTFPKDHLFMDVDSIPHGEDFVKVLETSVSQCEVLLAIIGNNWLQEPDENGIDVRLNDPYDFVRLEISSALHRDINVMPVLIKGADMPPEEALPDDIKALNRRNAFRISHENFRSDIPRLVTSLKEILNEEVTAPVLPEETKKSGRLFDSKVIKPVAVISLFLILIAGLYEFGKREQYQLLHSIGSNDANRVVSSPDGTTFVVMGAKIRIWNVNTNRLGRPIGETHVSLATEASFSPDGKLLVTGGCQNVDRELLNRCVKGGAKVWNISKRKLVQKIESYNSEVRAVAYSADGRSLFTAGCENYDDRKKQCASGMIKQWDAQTGELIRQFEKNEVWTMAVHPDGKWLFFAGSYSKIFQFDLTKWNVFDELDGHESGITSLNVSRDGNLLVSGSYDRTIRIWDLSNSSERDRTLEGHSDTVYAVDISPDNSKVVSTGKDRSVKLWSTDKGKLIAEFVGHSDAVDDVAFFARGQRVVSGSRWDRTIKIWDARSMWQMLPGLDDITN